MATSYHSIVKKYLDQNRIGCSLPKHIQRGWNRIYTLEEQEFNKRSCIIGSDVQIPNSIVRQRLGTRQIEEKTTIETLRKAFELPEELFLNLSLEHQTPQTTEDEKLSFNWNDDDDDDETTGKRKKSVVSTIINKQREKRRKFADYKYDYDNLDPLPLHEILEEIRTNIGKDLRPDDLKLITELMQIISRSKQDQVMNIFDELTDVHLISKFGGVPKLVQALQEIQKAFEQVAMKTNVASIETVIDVLLNKDHTYRLAAELLSSFNDNMKKNKQQQAFILNDKSGDISQHDHILFNMLINDRIGRLPASDLTILINDLKTIRNIDTSKLNKSHDDQVKFVSEQLNIIFTRAHFDGIKTTFDTMKSPISQTLREFIKSMENSLKFQLTEQENIIIESYIQDHLSSLNENELKITYEALAQQGTLKRHIGSGQLNQTITMGLMKNIETDGLGIVIENLKEAHLDVDSMNELVQELTRIYHYIQTQPSIPIEQIQNQLAMAYFVETRNLTEQDIQELSKSVNLYSIIHLPLVEKPTEDERSKFLDHLKAPFIRRCLQRILNLIKENTIDLNRISNQFYNERIIDLLHELIHGSEEFNRNLIFHQVKKQLKKNKDLVDKLYRQMLKEKLINIDTKVKVDTEKKKRSLIIKEVNRILVDKEDSIKRIHLMELMGKTDIMLPERLKQWYTTKSTMQTQQPTLSKIKKGTIDRKINTGRPSKIESGPPRTLPSNDRTIEKPIIPLRPTPLKQQIVPKDQLLPTTSSKYSGKRNVSRAKENSKIRKEMTEAASSSLTIKPDEHPKDKLLPSTADHPSVLSTAATITQSPTTDNVSKLQIAGNPIEQSHLSISKNIDEETNPSAPKRDSPNQQLDDHPPLNTIHTSIDVKQEFESSSSNTSESDTVLLESQAITSIDNEQKTNMQFDVIQPSHAKYDENNEILAALKRVEVSKILRPETISHGIMGENQTLNFELSHQAAPLFYRPTLSNDLKRDVHLIQSGKIAEFIDDSSYEKTRAQRVLAKAIHSSTIRQQNGDDTIGISLSSSSLVVTTVEETSTISNSQKLPGPPTDKPSIPISAPSLDNIKSTAKGPRTINKALKQTDDIYRNSLTIALRHLFSRSEYDNIKLRKIHEELIASGHISPLNEFYRSSNEALRVTLDHCVTYHELIKWTLALLQTNNKPNLTDFGHDLYSIAIDLDLALIARIDNTRCAMDIQESFKHTLQTISESDLREINSYLNASQLDKFVIMSKKLNVTSKDRMTSDLYSLLLHFIQACHAFPSKYRPMQTRIREIAETFKSRPIADLVRRIDEIEKHLSKTFAVTFFGISKRMNESRFILTK